MRVCTQHVRPRWSLATPKTEKRGSYLPENTLLPINILDYVGFNHRDIDPLLPPNPPRSLEATRTNWIVLKGILTIVLRSRTRGDEDAHRLFTIFTLLFTIFTLYHLYSLPSLLYSSTMLFLLHSTSDLPLKSLRCLAEDMHYVASLRIAAGQPSTNKVFFLFSPYQSVTNTTLLLYPIRNAGTSATLSRFASEEAINRLRRGLMK
jgi:hypothetical protein